MTANPFQQQDLFARQLASFSIHQAASELGVSTATVRNWMKAGYLNPTSRRPICFAGSEVCALRASISSGDVARLRTRANKSISTSTALPLEYMKDSSVSAVVEKIAKIFHREHTRLTLSALLFLIAIRVLELHREVKSGSLTERLDLDTPHLWKRQSLKSEIFAWHSTLAGQPLCFATYKQISRILLLTPEEDLLGLIYQTLVSEGHKSTKGSYYTPPNIVFASLTYQSGTPSSFLDPCCGTGQYLLCAAKHLHLKLEDIYGFDIDQLAVRIARINVLLAFPKADVAPKIECLNAITDLATGDVLCETNNLLGGFGFIATNPPWGAFKNVRISEQLTNGVRSNEAFSLILAKSIKLAKRGGRISFLLPESILKIKLHADIRELILEETRILRISHMGRPFSGVFTPVIRLDLEKVVPTKQATIVIEGPGGQHIVEQERFRSNQHVAFDANVTDGEDEILTRLHAGNFVTLKGHADWALGIVTGNNKAFVSDAPSRSTEPVFKGSDVRKFSLGLPSSYIVFTPEKFQQVAKVDLYRAPAKLIYKFISNRLVVAFDDKQQLTLNSANILIPRLTEMSIKVVLAFLNSNVLQYIFAKKFSTHKVLRGDLENLPLPLVTSIQAAEIENIVDCIIAGGDMQQALNEVIYAIFRATPEDISRIEWALFRYSSSSKKSG